MPDDPELHLDQIFDIRTLAFEYQEEVIRKPLHYAYDDRELTALMLQLERELRGPITEEQRRQERQNQQQQQQQGYEEYTTFLPGGPVFSREFGVFWRSYKAEFDLFLCTQSEKYRDLRLQLSSNAGKSQTVLVGGIAGTIGATLGIAAGAITPLIVLSLISALRIGKEAYCKTVESKRNESTHNEPGAAQSPPQPHQESNKPKRPRGRRASRSRSQVAD